MYYMNTYFSWRIQTYIRTYICFKLHLWLYTIQQDTDVLHTHTHTHSERGTYHLQHILQYAMDGQLSESYCPYLSDRPRQRPTASESTASMYVYLK